MAAVGAVTTRSPRRTEERVPEGLPSDSAVLHAGVGGEAIVTVQYRHGQVWDARKRVVG